MSTKISIDQKRGTERVTIALEDRGVDYSYKNLATHAHYGIPFTTISSKYREITEKSSLSLKLTAIFGVIGAGMFVTFLITNKASYLSAMWIYLFITLVCGLYYYFSVKSYFIIELLDGRSLVMLKDKPSKEELEKFVKVMYQAQNNFLKKHKVKIQMEN
ncbi:hypothetical protein FJZ18_02630 [Candidatus Pacearchaeota archaeon]|nr:hypothetical protein [Candidatus Pacearchaeota archaeon]